jgi:hypothetical protein
LNLCIPLGDYKGDYETFAFLLPYCKITAYEITNIVSANAVEMFKLLAKNKTNFNIGAYFYTIGGDMTPPVCSLFGLAVDGKAYEIAKLILQAHPDLDINGLSYFPSRYSPVWYFHTPLDDAIRQGNAEMIKWLKDRGARAYTELIPALLAKDPDKYIRARAKSTTDRLRLRSGENLKAKVVGYVDKGEEVAVLNYLPEEIKIDGLTSYWYYIYTKKKIFGWVYGGYLSFPETGH